MKYRQPFGASDPEASYVNGNPAIGLKGSIIDGRTLEETQRELVDFISKGGLTPSFTDLGQLAKAAQTGKIVYAAAGGTADALTCTLSPVPASYTAGFTIRVKAAAPNTGAAMTIDVNGLGTKAIKTAGGAVPAPETFETGGIYELCYDGSAFRIVNGFKSGFRNFAAYTTSGSFTPPAGCTSIYYEVWGAGGGGGATTGASCAAGGGGAGGHVRGTAAVTPGVAIPITVGVGGVSGNGVSKGGNGGASSVGLLATALGGTGGNSAGPGATDSVYGAGGSGGSASGQSGNLTVTGQSGYQPINPVAGGAGGNTWGFAGANPYAAGAQAPNVAWGFGAGGSGAGPSVSTPTNAGAPGLVIIWW